MVNEEDEYIEVDVDQDVKAMDEDIGCKNEKRLETKRTQG